MAKIRVAKSDREPDRTWYTFRCPGCEDYHTVNNTWQFNGDLDKPTFSPSILLRGTVPITDDEAEKIMNGERITPKPLVCHSFVTDGKIQFLSDCTHELAGHTVELPEVKVSHE
jgi:hypothetical protein